MSRLFDDVINHKKCYPELREAMRDCVVIKFDEINKMYAEHEQDYWDVRNDFPCVAPPFEKIFFESKMPTQYRIKTGMVGCDLGNRMGIFFDAAINQGNRIFPKSKWIINLMFFLDAENEIYPTLTLILGVTEDGIIEVDHGKLRGLSALMSREWKSLDVDVNKHQDRIIALKVWYLHPMLLALSFMHCKNVILMEHNPPYKVQQKRIKQNKAPLTKYYTLDITRPRAILKSEGNIDEVGLQRALHICRGHFKDYSKGKGLFGKYKGLYWWDSQVRGTEEAGRIEKDYNIKL